MKTSSTRRTVLSRTLHLTLGIGLSIGLVACSNPEPSQPVASDDSEPVTMNHDEMAHDSMNHEGMEHSAMDSETMSHEGMDHSDMSHNDMNPTEPPEALGKDYSIYQIGGDWVDANENKVALEDLEGKNQVVVMAYTSCQHTCPVLVRGMKKIEREMTPEALAQTEFLLVTLDTKRDTPVVMKNYAEHNELGDNWRLIRSDAATTRMLANTLNIQYKFADNGDINHSNFISILDKDGRLVAQEIGIADSGINPLIEYLNNQT